MVEPIALGGAVATLLGRCRFLKVLSLVWCALGDEGAAALTKCLEESAARAAPIKCGALVSVDFSYNGISLAALPLATILSRIAPRLERLGLFGSDILDTAGCAQSAVATNAFGRKAVVIM